MFAHLPLSDGAAINDALTQAGFRRSQNIAYRPACEACEACSALKTCKIEDDFQEIFEKMEEADGIIVGSPVYFGSALRPSDLRVDCAQHAARP